MTNIYLLVLAKTNQIPLNLSLDDKIVSVMCFLAGIYVAYVLASYFAKSFGLAITCLVGVSLSCLAYLYLTNPEPKMYAYLVGFPMGFIGGWLWYFSYFLVKSE